MERENKAILLFKQQIDQETSLLNKEKRILIINSNNIKKMYLFLIKETMGNLLKAV